MAGTGESLGDRDRPDGTRWSGLKFWADDPRSIIRAGAGYWRYVPTDDGVRFLTRYDYRPRWGRLGELINRHFVRPVFGWATAWSFDRLRIWLEDGVPPERQRNQAIAHTVAVTGLVGVWLYQGVVPKLIAVDPDEVALWKASLGLSDAAARRAVRAAGAATADPRSFTRAFNPVSLNWAVAALAVVAAVTADGLPSGKRPLRSAPDRQPDVGVLP